MQDFPDYDGYWAQRDDETVIPRWQVAADHVKEHIRHWTVTDFKVWAERYGLEVVRVQGQYGSRKLPWRRFPGLFSRQLIYTLRVAGQHSLGP
jgi:hypothetical protein